MSAMRGAVTISRMDMVAFWMTGTSLVRVDMIAPVRRRLKKESERPCRWENICSLSRVVTRWATSERK